MKRILFIVVLLISAFSLNSMAQQDRSAKVRAMRASYLSGKLNLTEQQATKFWPVFNRYSDERKALRGEYKKLFSGPQQNNMDKIQANNWVDDNIEYQEKELALKKKYKDELLKIISPQQLATLYQSEREFKKVLIEHLSKEGN
jgi:hypothetical protein